MPMNQNKKKIIGRLKKTYCRLQPSKIEGVGVFAIRDIPEGASIFCGANRQRWFKFTNKELDNLDQGIKKMIDDFFPTDEKDYILVPENGLNLMDLSFFLNHSNKSNCRITEGSSFIATKIIKKGEEVTSDYKTYDNNFKVWKKFKNLTLEEK